MTRCGLGERGLFVRNERAEPHRVPRKGPFPSGFVERVHLAQILMTIATRPKRAQNRVIQRVFKQNRVVSGLKNRFYV